MNGYPEHVHRGYVGFESFRQAEEFAKKYDGTVVELVRRDGHDFWTSRGMIFGMLEVGADTFGDDYSMESDGENWLSSCLDVIRDLCNEDDITLDGLSDALKQMKEISDKIENLEEDEAVLLYEGKYYDTIRTKTMMYSEDVFTHTVGVEINGYNDEADAECNN